LVTMAINRVPEFRKVPIALVASHHPSSPAAEPGVGA